MRVNIWIPTKELHESIKAQAGREGKSVSEYLLNIHAEHLNCLGNNKWDVDSLTKECSCARENDVTDKINTIVAEHALSVKEKLHQTDFFHPKPKKGKK